MLRDSVLPSVRRAARPQPLQPIAEPVEVLLDPVLDDLRAMAHVAQVRVDPLDHLIRAVAQLARHRVDRDGRAAVERLQPGGAVGVTEGLRSELAGAEAGSLRDAIEQSVDVPEPPLVAASGPRGHEEGAALL